jgi:hypothetical protein
MSERRGLTIYFTDGTNLKLDFPKQAANETAAILKLKDLLASRQILAEVGGVLLLIPFENIKYIEAHPAPPKLPELAIKGATIAGV